MTLMRVPLEVIRIEKPCPADWEEMRGKGEARFCEHCRKHVYNLSMMSRSAAEELVCRSGGNLCLRMQIEGDGRVATLDYQKKPSGRGWKFWTGMGLVGAMVAGIGQYVWIEKTQATPPPAAAMMMGKPMVPR